MRKDIPLLLRKAGLDGVLVLDASQDNPNFKFATNGAEIKGYYLWPARGKPTMLYGAMERDNLPKIQGMRAISFTELGKYIEKKSKTKGKSTNKSKKSKPMTMSCRFAHMVSQLLEKVKFKGKLALVGKVEAGELLEFASVLNKKSTGVKVSFEGEASRLFMTARATKDLDEIAIIEEAGKHTEAAIREVIDFIGTCRAKGRFVVNSKGKKVCIGHLRDILLKKLAQGGMDCPESPIIAQGEEAAVPHNIGTDSRSVLIGQPIVLDVFPRMTSTGYFFDTTRTVCPGEASAELKEIYSQVLKVQRATTAMLKAGVVGADVNQLALDMFEDWGHPTLRSHPGTTEGYCHGLGHGLGMNVHEWPNLNPGWSDKLEKGSVVTVEPGLYYANRQIGVRIEDVVALLPNGKVRNLCRNGKKLEIALKG